MTRPSGVNEGINQALEVAAVEGSPSVRLDGSGLVPTESATPKSELIKGSLARASHTSGPNGHRPDCGNPGISTSARVDVPEEIPNAGPYWGLSNLPPNQMTATKFAGERADSPNRQPSPVTQRTAMTSPVIHLESLADFNDEGETAWNAIRRAEVAKKMQRIAAGGYNSVDKLIELVEVGR